MSTFIIAEAGANHNRNFDQALSLIDVAVDAGASACKFQTYSSNTLYSKNTPDFAGYKNITQLIKEIELPREWQKDLKHYCDDKGIEFMSTPFDEKAVDELVALGVKRLKIAGFESTDFRFVEMVASSKLPLIISLGIGFDLKWLPKIFEIADKYGNPLTLLHCNNAYPTPMKDAGLETIRALSKGSGYKIGYSDHTTSTITPAFAVIAGATTIEKHFTINRSLPGPDHSFALEPHELKEMVSFIRQAELAMTPQGDLFSESEKEFMKAMRSVIAKKEIKKGEVFTKENITTKRPFLEGNIPASEFDAVLSQVAEKEYDEDDFI
ncbi:N-acetylneuraminate synthase family protein [Chlamydiales bacterium]|nr:N-acetylneuraminate synthase family protein [Chlamydiales bacterium]